MTGRLGVACQWLARDGGHHGRWRFRGLNRRNYLARDDAHLREIAFHNVRVLHEVVCALGRAPVRRRMFRIGNHVLPCLTLPEAARAWRDPGFVRDLSDAWSAVGRRARTDGVRLSTHPSQFIIPNSVRADVRRNSIADLDGWAHYADCLGGTDFCLNVHLGPRMADSATLHRSWRTARREMSAAAWRHLTVENDDKVYTIGNLLGAARTCGFRPVVDVHHHWCVTGHWPDPDRLGAAVLPLWPRGDPKIHLSLPKGQYFTPRALDARGLPILARGVPRTTPSGAADRYNPLAHAYLPWAPGVARYARGLLRHFDVMVEIKAKNLAVRRLCDSIDDLED